MKGASRAHRPLRICAVLLLLLAGAGCEDFTADYQTYCDTTHQCSTDASSPTTYPTLTLTVSGTGTGVVTSADGGVHCPSGCDEQFPIGTVAALTEVPTANSVFGGWTGACDGGAASCIVLMNGAESLGAIFNLKSSYQLTVQIASVADAGGVVTSADGGIDCGTFCVATVPASEMVTLRAFPDAGFGFSTWSNPCANTGSSCSFSMTQDMVVTATFSPFNYIFVTSGTILPSALGTLAEGLDAGDEFCQQSADFVGLPGRFVAYVANDFVDARSRIPSTARGWIRPDGQPFADKFSDVLTAYQMFYPPRIDELLHDHGGFSLAMIGANPDGTRNQTCNNWTQGNTFSGGLTASGAQLTLGGWSGPCDAGQSIYCMGVDYNTQVTVPPVPDAKLVFVTHGNFQTDGGLAGADALCQAEAVQAGFPGGATYSALLPTTGQSAAMRFVASTSPVVRPDGVLVSSTVSTFLVSSNDLLSSINVTPSLNYSSAYTVITGSTAIDQTPANGMYTCNDWTSYDVGFSAWYGNADFTVPGVYWGTGVDPCGPLSTDPIYCLQQ